jgi:hypothetical protein
MLDEIDLPSNALSNFPEKEALQESPQWVEIEGQVFINDYEKGTYHLLSPVASDIWKRLQQNLSPEDILQELSSLYEVDPTVLKQDIETFLSSLKHQKLWLPHPE